MKNLIYFLFGCIASLLLYRGCFEEVNKGDPGVVVDTITYMDTIHCYYPVPKDSTVIKYLSVKVPVVSDNRTEIADSVPKYAKNDKELAKCVPVDSVDVQIPISQIMYEGPQYKAYVSGFQPHLDSLLIYSQRDVVTAFERRKPPRWHLGPSVGVGITPKGFQPMLGVTLTYSIFSW